jgi:hypothetical protein
MILGFGMIISIAIIVNPKIIINQRLNAIRYFIYNTRRRIIFFILPYSAECCQKIM